MLKVKKEIISKDKNVKTITEIHPKNFTNDLTGAEWKYSTMSVIDKNFPIDFQHKLRSEHGGQKPPKLCEQLIKTFTKEGQIILDPFAGVGGTLLGATISKRKAIGIDLNPRWKEIYEQVCDLEKIATQNFIVGDSKEVLDNINQTFDFILTDVPYWNMDKLTSNRNLKSARESKLSKFNNNETETLEEWLENMKIIIQKSVSKLKEKGYVAIFIGDLYRDKNFYPLSSHLMFKLLEIPNLLLKSDIIWVDKSKSLHIFGYPFSYVPSIIHQHILIFKKEK